MPNIVKVPRETWISMARETLIDEGLEGLKAIRLAKKLNVTRGGFYHNFKNIGELRQALLQNWRETNHFLPPDRDLHNPVEALEHLEQLLEKIIREVDFSPAYEMAVREWARLDPAVRKTVDKVDRKRQEGLTKIFRALGCDEDEAPIRARVFYYHQIGYYSLGDHLRESAKKRLSVAPIYTEILCGKRYIDAAKKYR